jgi:hypothetical protein
VIQIDPSLVLPGMGLGVIVILGILLLLAATPLQPVPRKVRLPVDVN